MAGDIECAPADALEFGDQPIRNRAHLRAENMAIDADRPGAAVHAGDEVKYLLEPLLRYRRGKRRELLGRKHGIGRERWGATRRKSRSRVREQLEIVTVTFADMEIVDRLMRRECHDHAVASTKHRPEAVFREPGEGGGSRTLRHTTQEIQVISGGIRRSWQDLDRHTARLQLRDSESVVSAMISVFAPTSGACSGATPAARSRSPSLCTSSRRTRSSRYTGRPPARTPLPGQDGVPVHSGLDRERALGATLADEHCVGYRPTQYPLGPAHRQLEDCRRILLRSTTEL